MAGKGIERENGEVEWRGRREIQDKREYVLEGRHRRHSKDGGMER